MRIIMTIHTKIAMMIHPIKKDIFGDIIQPKIEKKELSINGLTYIDNWISNDFHDELISLIDLMPWETSLKRRVQQYGYIYNYKKASTFISSNKNNYIGELPEFLVNIGKRLVSENLFIKEPEQVIINEYIPGQGITNHVDCVPCFGDTICSLSLGSQCVMDFKNKNLIVNKLLNKNSLLIIKDEARYNWSHGIRANITDIIGKERVERNRRLSITFRNIIE